MFMLLSEQARGRPGARGHHVGDPWYRCSAKSKKRKNALR